MRIAHLLSDNKFVDEHIKKYIESDFYNDYFYLKLENNYKGAYQERVTFLNPEGPEYLNLVDSIEQYDIVILYYLNLDKLQFLEKIKESKVKIIWCFYGVELYSLSTIRNEMLSERTQIATKGGRTALYQERLKAQLRKVVFPFRKGNKDVQRLEKACQRLDHFLWYNRFEYDYLNDQVGHMLPPLIEAPLNIEMDDVVPNMDKQNSILIGNSAAYYNNHLDALAVLKSKQFAGNISMPFSYGKKVKYESFVTKYASRSGLNIDIIDKFVGYEEYIRFVNQHAAAVYPSLRQMGLGNIFIAIRCGLKIYLREKNQTFNWLRDKGMKIYSFEKDFESDLLRNNLILDLEYIELNNAIYSSMVGPGNNQDLFNKFHNISKEVQLN